MNIIHTVLSWLVSVLKYKSYFRRHCRCLSNICHLQKACVVEKG